MHGSKKYPSVDIHPRSVPAIRRDAMKRVMLTRIFFVRSFPIAIGMVSLPKMRSP